MADSLLLAVPPDDSGGEPTVLRVRVPAGMAREDVYFQVLAEVPADAPQPVALNIERAAV